MAALQKCVHAKPEVKKARAGILGPKFYSLGGQFLGKSNTGEHVHTNPPGNESYSASNLVGTSRCWHYGNGLYSMALNAAMPVHLKQKPEKKLPRPQLEALASGNYARYLEKPMPIPKTTFGKTRVLRLALLKAAEESYAATQESYTHGFSTVMKSCCPRKRIWRAAAVIPEIDSRSHLTTIRSNSGLCDWRARAGRFEADSEAFGRSLPQ